MNDKHYRAVEWSPEYYFLEPYPEGLETLFPKEKPVWEALKEIGGWIQEKIRHAPSQVDLPPALTGWKRPAMEGGEERLVTTTQGLFVEKDIGIPEWGLFLSAGVVIEPMALIKAPTYIGTGTEIRHGAYIRGNVIIGPRCTVGHDTEIKSSVFLHRVEAGHFAYIGDSILGHYVNLGAGTKLANLPFRTLEDKKNEAFPVFPLVFGEETVDTGLNKFGSILGDGVETGCNATLAPGTFLGPGTWVYPCHYLRKGFYSRGRIIKTDARQIGYQNQRA